MDYSVGFFQQFFYRLLFISISVSVTEGNIKIVKNGKQTDFGQKEKKWIGTRVTISVFKWIEV